MAGHWKDRPIDALAKDLEAAVCDAAARCDHPHVEEELSGSKKELPTKKARSDGASEHIQSSISQKRLFGTTQQSTGVVEVLPETPEDVCTLRRIGSDMFEAIFRSGAVWTDDVGLLKTLPHGEAKFATLTLRELVTASKAKAKVKAKAKATPEEERHPEEVNETTTAATFQSGTSEGVLNDAGIVDKEEMGQPKPNKRRRIEHVLDVESGAKEHVVKKQCRGCKSRSRPLPSKRRQ